MMASHSRWLATHPGASIVSSRVQPGSSGKFFDFPVYNALILLLFWEVREVREVF